MRWRTAALFFISALLPLSWPTGPALAADASSSYVFAPDAEGVEGATGTADARLLQAGTYYRSSLPSAAKRYYRLDLDASSNAYVSVTAVPRTDARVSVAEGIKVTVQNTESHICSTDSATFGTSGSPHPITALGARTTAPRTPVCADGGTYYVVVERVGTADSAPGDWDLELTTTTEPGLTGGGVTSAPQSWNSATPTPLPGAPAALTGGAGFAVAAAVGQGVWRTTVPPGRTLFYKVPVDWGQQLSVTAELGATGGGRRGYAIDALDMTLYNPVRGEVEGTSRGYNGKQLSAPLAALPPVDYGNRFAGLPKVNAMRFAGFYYLVVHLSDAVADTFGDGPFEVTLRIRLAGGAQDGPAYGGQSVPRNVFHITAQDREITAQTVTGPGTATGNDGGTAMKALAAGGIGAGTVLLAVLGVWTVTARRRARVV
ncbi:hypothetical protein ABZT17_28295 [Streptomyces sp. NPDC005648]|uniref:hypothetical protein n=1 Tax=Streptomyces sp. NPDC005648 TaxID=3157044 RepID=UPI00339DC2E9